MTIKIGGPIPGNSLTKEVGNAPYEQPPLHADPNKALAWHLGNLNKGSRMEDLLFMLNEGFPLDTFVQSLTTSAVMEGYHSIDSSVLISPVIHQYIKEAAQTAGINLTEWDGPTDEDKANAKFKSRLQLKLANALKEKPAGAAPEPMFASPTESPIPNPAQPAPQGQTPEGPTPPPAQPMASGGLIKRRTK